jgi:isocitrate/isopropylmalate dehydrogenase
LRHAAEERELADQLERAIDGALSRTPTRDVGGVATTAEFTDAVLSVGAW